MREGTDTSVSMAVVRAIAASEGIDPLDLDFALADYIDTDALDRLFAGEAPRSLTVSFAVEEHDVVVDGDGSVTVDDHRFVPSDVNG